MNGEPDALIAQLGPPSELQWLLVCLDACRADKASAEPELRREAMRQIEQRLVTIVPTTEADLFNLAARLRDRELAPATRKAIASNVARAAPLMASRQQRFLSWLTTCAAAIAELQEGYSKVIDHLANGIDLLQATQPVPATPIEMSLHELDEARLELVVGNLMFEDRIRKLNELATENVGEAAVFAEAVSATKH